jgi:hypothetical protein
MSCCFPFRIVRLRVCYVEFVQRDASRLTNLAHRIARATIKLGERLKGERSLFRGFRAHAGLKPLPRAPSPNTSGGELGAIFTNQSPIS